MDPEELHSENIRLKTLATLSLLTLRKARDEQPLEWDILMGTPVGVDICKIWDALRFYFDEELVNEKLVNHDREDLMATLEDLGFPRPH